MAYEKLIMIVDMMRLIKKETEKKYWGKVTTPSPKEMSARTNESNYLKLMDCQKLLRKSTKPTLTFNTNEVSLCSINHPNKKEG